MRRNKEQVKTAKGRRISSTRWLNRQLNDVYVQRAKDDGYCSRAAYKLIEIDDKFKFLRPDLTVLDLGSAPGSWSQVLVNRNIKNIVSVDLNHMEYDYGVYFIQGNFMHDDTREKIFLKFPQGINLILSDMAPKACGINHVDHLRIMELCNDVLKFSLTALKDDGHLIMKILRGEEDAELLATAKQYFTKAKYFKPKSSRADSAEMFLVGLYKKKVSN